MTSDSALAGAPLPIAGERFADLRGQISWTLFEFARQPYVSLVFVYVFAPYFANTVVGDPVRGQEAWSFANTMAGVAVGALAPFLGAIADRMGRRKPWVLASILFMAPACWALWYAMPGGAGGLAIAIIIALLAYLLAMFELGAIFHNSMLASIVPTNKIGRLSGWGIGIGAIGTIIALVVMLFGVALPASDAVTWSFIPERPLFGLDPAMHEHERIVGPVAGVWMVIFVIPLLLWTPDRPSTRVAPLAAIGDGLRQVWITIKRARQIGNVGLYLLARMIYNDGLVAIVAYSGIYAVGAFGWDLAETLIFGFILSSFCVLGGFVGAWLDINFGSKRAILIGGLVSVISMAAALSSTGDRLFFLIPYDAAAVPLSPLPYFRTLPEMLFIGSYVVLAVFATAVFANSRAMMARISPLSTMSQFFGLYALSGTATAFLGHGLVNLFTHAFQSQRAGLASTLILLVIGFGLVARVKEERAPEATG